MDRGTWQLQSTDSGTQLSNGAQESTGAFLRNLLKLELQHTE